MTTKRKLILFLIFAWIAGFAAACSNTSDPKEASDANAKEQTSSRFPMAVEHAKGMHTLTEEPQRIAVVFEWYNIDNLLSLGIKPVAITHDPPWYKNQLGVASYMVDLLEGIQTIGNRDSVNIERLALAKPDLIVGIHTPMVEQQYPQLNRIAPTLLMDGYDKDWKEYHRSWARIFGKENEAENTIKEIENKTEQVRKQVEGSIGNDKLAVIQILPKTLRLFAKDDLTELLYNELGLKPIAAAEQAKGITEISLESLAEMNPDHILLYWTQPDSLDLVANTGVWNNLKAVQNGHVYFPETTIEWNPSGPIGRSVLLDRIAETFTGK